MILIVENDASWAAALTALFHTVFGEPSAPEVIGLAGNVTAADEIARRVNFNDVELVLVDLELGAGSESGPGDYNGRDVVLPLIRKLAPWVPVILVSRYISGDPSILAEVTPYDFDAVVPKGFFSTPKTNVKQWKELRSNAAIRRVAALTGRSRDAVADALRAGIDLDYGAGVREHVDRLGKSSVEDLLRLVGFASTRVVLDELVQGYSGLSVVKATARRPTSSATWLLKFGSDIGKLQRELSAHRRMFEDGFTRRLSVPVYWWNPVVWNAVGIIAYEFEGGADTLLALAKRDGIDGILPDIILTLREFYRGAATNTVVPRTALARLVGCGLPADGMGEIVSALVREQRCERLDRSVFVMVGREHGDMHARNILLGSREPVLIDFAHYRSAEDIGVPLFDLAKLCVDLSVWEVAALPLPELASGEALGRDVLRGLLPLYIADSVGGPSDDERRLFALASTCLLAQYASYDDVPSAKRHEIVGVLTAAS